MAEREQTTQIKDKIKELRFNEADEEVEERGEEERGEVEEEEEVPL